MLPLSLAATYLERLARDRSKTRKMSWNRRSLVWAKLETTPEVREVLGAPTDKRLGEYGEDLERYALMQAAIELRKRAES